MEGDWETVSTEFAYSQAGERKIPSVKTVISLFVIGTGINLNILRAICRYAPKRFAPFLRKTKFINHGNNRYCTGEESEAKTGERFLF